MLVVGKHLAVWRNDGDAQLRLPAEALYLCVQRFALLGLADSVSDAARKIKAGAVQINGEKVKEVLLKNAPAELLIQVGKNWKRVGG